MFGPGDTWITALASSLAAARCGDMRDGDDGVVERHTGLVVQNALNGVSMIVMTVGCPKSEGGQGGERKEANNVS